MQPSQSLAIRVKSIVDRSNLEDIEIDRKVENYRLELLAVLKGDNIISLTSAKRREKRTMQ